MDEESIESNLATYKQQLSQIETVLQSAGTEGQEDLVQLRKDLTELVELTEASLLSVKKSKLLGFVDNLEASASGSALSQTSMNEISGQQCQDDDEEDDEDVDDDDEDEDDDDEAAVNAIIGTTCSVQYMPGWGPTQYCNAVILSVESLGETENDKGQVRVLFCNPTSNSMLPCPHFLDGECRFDDKCRFSHGYIVNVEDIQPFRDPDYSLLTLVVGV
uniref:Zinc finger CCCH-type with G patch domain-containing protein-like isoform X1 n=1 Tax=Saccoglossus kowalevskii TaxID=10224 RepID=A0ABM0GSC3_SACKO|nr:PREDICTED: zinc finger CCCH-type with G patch domain-containing protein-like isoform X1 [Saccoglossus kowalevskii]